MREVWLSKCRALCYRLGSPRILFWTLPALILLLFVGTIAQKYIGLYVAIQLYFDSWIIWLWGIVPLPGFYPIMLVFSINLACRFLFRSPWSWQKAGLHMAHFGVLVLVIGGLFTALTAEEGYLLLEEGGSNSFISDYHDRALVLFDGKDAVDSVNYNQLKPQQLTSIGPFTFHIENRCRNCSISARTENVQTAENMAKHMALSAKSLETEDERNMSGITFTYQDKTYIAFEGMPKPIDLNTDNKNYQLLFGKTQRALPFTITLEKFTQKNYPGSNKAQDYSSDVIVTDGKKKIETTISLNQPLRYKGYSFYQSSFERTPEHTYSILSVVKNKGRTFPYLACLIIGLGLIYHSVISFRQVSR